MPEKLARTLISIKLFHSKTAGKEDSKKYKNWKEEWKNYKRSWLTMEWMFPTWAVSLRLVVLLPPKIVHSQPLRELQLWLIIKEKSYKTWRSKWKHFGHKMIFSKAKSNHSTREKSIYKPNWKTWKQISRKRSKFFWKSLRTMIDS